MGNSSLTPIEEIPEATVTHLDIEWRTKLTPLEYKVCRKKGTERAYTGEYHNLKERGKYHCKCCDTMLFDSQDKYESFTGWPSFSTFAFPKHVGIRYDQSHKLLRKEVICIVCHAHLGHVFNDGPPPFGKRYCMNSIALRFVPHSPSSESWFVKIFTGADDETILALPIFPRVLHICSTLGNLTTSWGFIYKPTDAPIFTL